MKQTPLCSIYSGPILVCYSPSSGWRWIAFVYDDVATVAADIPRGTPAVNIIKLPTQQYTQERQSLSVLSLFPQSFHTTLRTVFGNKLLMILACL